MPRATGEGARDPTDILPLTGELVDAWNPTTWEWDDLSDAMMSLGRHFWAMVDEGPDQTELIWHHLVMAVGNFKRQTPIRGLRLSLPPTDAQPRASFTPPNLSFSLADEDPESWQRLERSVRGFGVPTASTLLSALWPGSHAVIDRFAFRAAVGLRAAAGWTSRDGAISPEDTHPVGDEVTWRDYRDYRRWVFRTADEIGRSAVMVERTLYRLPRIPDVDGGRTWRRYGEELLHQDPPGMSGSRR